MDVGRISNMNYMMTPGRVNSPAESYFSNAGNPRVSPSNPAASMPTYGLNALFLSSDGDFAEISNRAMNMSLLTENGILEELKAQGVCFTCENRRYVDQSDDASVSFQTPTKISPSMAAAAVASHEQEHVRNEQARAHREDREIINQSVTLTYDTCPECGKQFVSGGTTRTTSISRGNDDEGFEGDFDGDAE